MILLDTDTFSFLLAEHPRITARFHEATEEVATTLITRIEALEGRFAFLLKAADGEQLLRTQDWLRRTEDALSRIRVVPVDAAAAAAAAGFDRLRENKKLKKIGRADLLIATVALAHKATLVTRNEKDFRQVPGLQVENWAD
jgi:tRNA(fMet)-specific endonuclease VapC